MDGGSQISGRGYTQQKKTYKQETLWVYRRALERSTRLISWLLDGPLPLAAWAHLMLRNGFFFSFFQGVLFYHVYNTSFIFITLT